MDPKMPTPPETHETSQPLSVVGWLLVKMVLLYQVGISPFLGNNCRFYPTCSEYFILSVRKDGAMRGSLRGMARICRCHPFHSGGIDLP